MDEPLSNLDAKLRNDMRAELKRLHMATGDVCLCNPRSVGGDDAELEGMPD